jgi:hypothetical protein
MMNRLFRRFAAIARLLASLPLSSSRRTDGHCRRCAGRVRTRWIGWRACCNRSDTGGQGSCDSGRVARRKSARAVALLSSGEEEARAKARAGPGAHDWCRFEGTLAKRKMKRNLPTRTLGPPGAFPSSPGRLPFNVWRQFTASHRAGRTPLEIPPHEIFRFQPTIDDG